MTITIRAIDYHAAGVRYVGRLAVDEQRPGRWPGVLVAPEAPGLGEHVEAVIRRLAELGYVAFGVDYHGDGRVLSDMGEMMGVVGAFLAEPEKIRVIAAAALDVLAAQPQTDPVRLAAIGYCFGGTAALELARSGADLKAVAGFHCGLGSVRPQDAGQIKAKVLVLIGAEDPIAPPPVRAAFEAEMTAGGVDWRLNLYGGAGHSFTNPEVDALGQPGFAYDAKTDRRSWAAMLDLFDETFGPLPASEGV
jgi:dienelactone hydrolase